MDVAEGWSLQWGSWSILPVLVGDQFRALELPSVGAAKRVKVVAFSKWVSVYSYESAQVQECKQFLILISFEDWDDIGGFLPHWISTLNPCVHVCFMCDNSLCFYCTCLLLIKCVITQEKVLNCSHQFECLPKAHKSFSTVSQRNML